MDIKMELHSSGPSLIFDLMQRTTVSENDEVQIAEGMHLRYVGLEPTLRDAGQVDVVFSLILSIASGITVNVAAAMFLDYLKEKGEQGKGEQGKDQEEKIIEIKVVDDRYQRHTIDRNSIDNTAQVLERASSKKRKNSQKKR